MPLHRPIMGAVGSGSWVPGVDEVGTVSVDRDAKSSESPGPWLLCCHSRPPPPPPPLTQIYLLWKSQIKLSVIALVFLWVLLGFLWLLSLLHLASISFVCFETILWLGYPISPAWRLTDVDLLLLNTSVVEISFPVLFSEGLRTLLGSRASWVFLVSAGRVSLVLTSFYWELLRCSRRTILK